MKTIKYSSIVLLTVFFMWAFIPQASARHHHRSHSSFGLSFNVNPGPAYVVAPAPVIAAPAPVMVAPAPVAVMPYRPYVAAPVYAYPYPYAYYSAPAVMEPPTASLYVQPGFSFSYFRR